MTSSPAPLPEDWRPVPGSPYEASSLGQIRDGRTGNVLALTPCKGFLRAGQLWVHILVCNAFHGPKPSPEHSARHRDGVRDDNRAENLHWATGPQTIAAKPLVTRRVIKKAQILRNEGHSPAEIATALRLSEFLVGRILSYQLRGSA